MLDWLIPFWAVKFIWETLEGLHLGLVAYEAGKMGHEGVKSLSDITQERYQEWQDEKYPEQKLEREAKSLYDFQASGDAVKRIMDIKKEAKDYLTELNNKVRLLNEANDYLSKMQKITTNLVGNMNENHTQLSSKLLVFIKHFNSFAKKIREFSLPFLPPPRQCLYIASSWGEVNAIEKYNNYLQTIKEFVSEIKETKLKINDQLNKAFDSIKSIPSTSYAEPSLSFEEIQQSFQQCMEDSVQTQETMNKILPRNKEFANLCTELIKNSKDFQQNYQFEQTAPWDEDANWFPLLTEEEQVEVGQRIFLYAMNEAVHSEDEKRLLAEMFLRKAIANPVMNQIKLDLLAYEIAFILRDWQINKCKQLTQFLNRLTEDAALPMDDPDGLLTWLKTKKREQNPIQLFKEILVSPCCHSQLSMEAAFINFQRLGEDEDLESLIQKYQDSHWGAVWEKTDSLIQLPKGTKTGIFPEDRLSEDPSNPYVVSSGMQKLASELVAELTKLKDALVKNKESYVTPIKICQRNKKEAEQAQKDKEQGAGVARIKKAHLRLPTPDDNSKNSLSPYLHNVDTVNEMEKKRQVPTADDLLQVIYRGINPNEACHWQAPSLSLLSYIFPGEKNDSRSSAWHYAIRYCQVNLQPVFVHLFPSKDSPLPLEYTRESVWREAIKNSPFIQAFFTKEVSPLTPSKALTAVLQKTVKETEVVVKKLHDYHVLALVRMKPDYKNEALLAKEQEKDALLAKERQEKEELKAELERLKSSVAKQEGSTPTQAIVSGSRVTLFSVPASSQASMMGGEPWQTHSNY